MEHRAVRPRSRIAGILVLALVVAACLPEAVRPTPTPGPTSPPTPTAPPTPVPTPGPPTPTPAPTFALVTVQRGDSLLSIAKRYGTTGRSVAYWNRDTYPSLDPDSADYDPDTIQVGWVLRLIPNQAFQPGDEPTPTPRPTPQPSLVIMPGPTPLAGTSVLVSNGARGGNAVALTFDAGGPLDEGVAIVTWLVDSDVPATVFAVGQAATGTTSGRETLALVAAHPGLLTLGNGTWDGADVTSLSGPALADQLARTDAAVIDATGRSTKPFFRPPLGAHDAGVRNAAWAAGWAFTVLWDVDALDAKPQAEGGPTVDDIVGKVLARAQGGSIVLLHLGGEATLAALPRIVEGLRARGLEPVTLHRLLGFEPGG